MSQRRLRLGHPVADSRLGEDVGGVVRVVAQLAAELAYDGAHGPHVAAALLAPDPFQQMLVGQQPPGMAESSASSRYSIAISGSGRPARLTRRSA